MIEFSESYGELTKALLEVQSKVSVVVRDATNPHFKSRYATLENVVAAVRPHCIEQGLIITQAAGIPDSGMVPVETRIIHVKSGQWLKSTIALPATKQDAQGVGSAVTYACRYSLMSLFCLPPADDDGNAASNGNGKQPDKSTAGGMTKMDERTVSDGRQKSASKAKKDGDQELYNMIEQCESKDDLTALYREQRAAIEILPPNWANLWWEKFDARSADFATLPVTLAG